MDRKRRTWLRPSVSRRIREAYGGETWRRLAEIKATYDPDNVFHHHQNIRPAISA
jgi:FAD/FMN-containing dehydrogenase